jgi:chitinase
MPRFRCFLLLMMSVVTGCFSHAASPDVRSFVITGYVFARGAALVPGQVDASGLTRINYAFANIQGGRMVTGSTADGQNFALLRSLETPIRI